MKFIKIMIYVVITVFILWTWVTDSATELNRRNNTIKNFLLTPVPPNTKCIYLRTGSKKSISTVMSKFSSPNKDIDKIFRTLKKYGWNEYKNSREENDNYVIYTFVNNEYEYYLTDYSDSGE